MKRRLLIVEDSDTNRELLVQLLEESFALEQASDGRAAVELAASTSPDLILMDIGLPGLSGLDAVRAIRAGGSAADTPIVAVSSRVMPGEREEALEAGCDAFIAKPIDDALLLDTVTRLLEGDDRAG